MRKTFYVTAVMAVLIQDNFTNAITMKPNNQYATDHMVLTQTQTFADIEEPIAPNPTAFFNVNTKDGIKATPNNDGTAIRLNLKSGKAAPAPEKAATPTAAAATPAP